MIAEKEAGLKTWFVVFHDAHQVGDWIKILKQGFQHCWAFTYDARTDTWLKVDVTNKHMAVQPLTKAEAIKMLRAANDCVTVQYTAKPDKFLWKTRFFVNCSSVVAYLLGINIFFHTPWRLFCELRKRGGIVTLPKGYSLENL